MEIGAFFILILVVVVLGVIGLAVYAIAARGRQRQLSSKGGTLDGRREPPPEDSRRPEHLEVDTEQRAHFTGSR